MPKYRVFDILWDTDAANLPSEVVVDVPQYLGPMSVAAAVQKEYGASLMMSQYEEVGEASQIYDLGIEFQLFSPRKLKGEEVELIRYNLQRLFDEGKDWIKSNLDRPFDKEVFTSTPIYRVKEKQRE